MVLNNGGTGRLRIIYIIRCFSFRPAVALDETVNNEIQNNVYKPKHHPGRMKIKNVVLPQKFIDAALNVVEDYPIKKLIDDGNTLSRYLKGRFPPVEPNELEKIKQDVMTQVLEKEQKPIPETELEKQRYQQSIKSKAYVKLKSTVYNWNPVTYDAYTSLVYLYGRFAPEYAVMCKIFNEITVRDSTFKPRSLFDFGSGVGTVTWAANEYWKNSFFEYFNVDASRYMNDLAVLLLQGGRENVDANIKGTFYRQFLPSTHVAYDLVVCAYSLLELPSAKTRFQTILNLWNKTSGYLVVVEQGTNAGFKVINQVRDLILNLGREGSIGHVFSPCPHDTICPRFLTDITPCSFDVSYMSPPFEGSTVLCRERYSYVVLKKGKRDPDDPQWPRVVRQPLVRSKHTVCRLCTNCGKLDEIILTAARHGKSTYYCGRSSDSGDLLPMILDHSNQNEK